MGFGFKTLEHGLASVAHDMVVGAHAVAAASGKVADAAPEIEAITGMIDPPAVVVERAAFSALGYIAKAANDTGAASKGKGLNLQLDDETIADFKKVYDIVSQQLAALSKFELKENETATRAEEFVKPAAAKA